MYTITIKCLIPNAFIAYMERTGKRTLSMLSIDSFGKKVLEQLIREGEDVRLDYKSKEFFYEYSHIFRLTKVNKKEVVELTDEKITKEDLIEKFSGYVPLKILVALRDEENIKSLIED